MRLLLLSLCLFAACGDKSEAPVEEADTDTDSDTDSDTDVDVEPWSWCPDADAWRGDETWTGTLTVTGGAVYCASPQEYASFAELLANKRQLLVIEGSYPHPEEAGSADIALPVCTRFPGEEHADMDGVGTLETWTYDYEGAPIWGQGSQPLTNGHTLEMVLSSGGGVFDLTLDGGGGDGPDNDALWSIDDVVLSPCGEDTWNPETHALTFEGGRVELLVQVDRYGIGDGTEPSVFPSASGTLDGTDFDITEPFQLLYSPDHHHFGRHWVVLFDDPIGEACGLQADVDDVYVEEATVQLVDCALEVLEARTVTEVVFTR